MPVGGTTLPLTCSCHNEAAFGYRVLPHKRAIGPSDRLLSLVRDCSLQIRSHPPCQLEPPRAIRSWVITAQPAPTCPRFVATKHSG
jgi:hypothetical protein